MAGVVSLIQFGGKPCAVACDGKCSKAWGINSRPSAKKGMELLPDHALPEAPANPGTFEGECGKPASLDEAHNKWCVRECERSAIAWMGESQRLPTFEDRERGISIPLL